MEVSNAYALTIRDLIAKAHKRVFCLVRTPPVVQGGRNAVRHGKTKSGKTVRIKFIANRQRRVRRCRPNKGQRNHSEGEYCKRGIFHPEWGDSCNPSHMPLYIFGLVRLERAIELLFVRTPLIVTAVLEKLAKVPLCTRPN